MKARQETIGLTVEWYFLQNGSVMHSTPIAGYQGKIHKSTLTIYSVNGGVYEYAVKSRAAGRKLFSDAIARFLGSL